MLCSARIANNGPTFVGRVERVGGSTEEEVLRRLKGSNPEVGPRLMPIMLQTVRSIWFDTVVALVFVLGLGFGGLWMLLRSLLMKGERSPSDA
jgi:hypothetical protein